MSSDHLLLWASLSVLVLSVATAATSRRRRFVWINIAAASFAVLLFSGYKQFHGIREHFDPVAWSLPNEIVGNMARPNQTFRWSKKQGLTTIFDTTVRTNADGFRVTPPAPNATKSILFLGCSYTFGHGVEDRETYPFLVGQDLGGASSTYNISFPGWGPHQILAALQSGLVEHIVKEPPRLAVFLTITDHVRRVIGREENREWDRAPRFVLENGVAVRRGRFEDDHSRKRFSSRDPGYWTSFAPEDFQLYGAVVKGVRDEVVRRFPGVRFEMILWDADVKNPARGPVLDALRTRGIFPRLSDEFLVDGRDDPFRYMISKDEKHPSPEGQRLLARFVETAFLNQH